MSGDSQRTSLSAEIQNSLADEKGEKVGLNAHTLRTRFTMNLHDCAVHGRLEAHDKPKRVSVWCVYPSHRHACHDCRKHGPAAQQTV